MAARDAIRRILPAGVVLALSFLWALDALRSDLWPYPFRAANQLPFFEHEFLRWAVLALAAVALALIRRISWPGKRALLHAVLAGVGLFVIPNVLVHACGSFVSDLTRVALFTMTPLFALVLEPFLSAPGVLNAKGGMAAALALVAGTFLLFPFTLPNSGPQALAEGLLLLTVAFIASVTCSAVRIAREPSAPTTVVWALVSTISATLCFGVTSLMTQPPVAIGWRYWPAALWTLLIDFPVLLAFFWLLMRISATRITLRFVLAPLFAALLSLMIFVPSVSISAAAGLVLMAAGAGWMLLGPDAKSPSGSALGLEMEK